MSYILDALNKSERERLGLRHLDSVPSISARSAPKFRFSQRWQIDFGVILTLNVAVLTAWYFTSGDSRGDDCQ